MVQKHLNLKRFGDSHLSLQLIEISERMGKWGIGFASLIGLILFCEVMWISMVKKDLSEYKQYLTSLTIHVIYCLALIVVAVPEGLKLIETVSISYSLRQLD
jgi:magnesium-transporting ATPase (P-type)